MDPDKAAFLPLDPDEGPCPIDPRGNPPVPCPMAQPCADRMRVLPAPCRQNGDSVSAGMGKRSGSETRQRRRFVAIRLTDDEHARVRLLCGDGGQSVAALLRTALLATPLPRRRRVSADHTALAKLLAELQGVAAELGKQGSNLNQLAHQANADRMPAGYAERLADALEEHDEQGRTLLELREACMRALGIMASDAD